MGGLLVLRMLETKKTIAALPRCFPDSQRPPPHSALYERELPSPLSSHMCARVNLNGAAARARNPLASPFILGAACWGKSSPIID
jgi:hypothetical protein